MLGRRRKWFSAETKTPASINNTRAAVYVFAVLEKPDPFGLVDDIRPKYVGETKNIKRRFKQHLEMETNPALKDWLLNNRNARIYYSFDGMDDEGKRKELEKDLISHYMETFKLFNIKHNDRSNKKNG